LAEEPTKAVKNFKTRHGSVPQLAKKVKVPPLKEGGYREKGREGSVVKGCEEREKGVRKGRRGGGGWVA